MSSKYSLDRIKVLVTSACNSNCTHCFRNKDKNTYSLSKEKLIEIVDYGISNGCREFSFSGGEFFTHEFAYGLIEYCLSKDVYVSILTNALEFDCAFFSRIEKKDFISFQISIDGMEYQHDLRRGQGAYRRTIENVQFLYSLGYSIAAKMVLDKHNYTDFVDVLQLPWFHNILVLPVADFDGTNDSSVMANDTQEYEEAVVHIYRHLSVLQQNQYGCDCFPHELAIKYNGEVFPCTEAREHDVFSMGNITDRSLDDVIQTYEINCCEKLNCQEYVVEQCGDCPSKRLCKQGCRLRALRYHGDLRMSDPFNCRIYRDKHKETPLGRLFWGE